MVPKQTRFQHWIYILQTLFLKIFVQGYLNREVKSSLTTLLIPQQRFVLGLSSHCFGPIWGLIPSLSYHCFLNSSGNSVSVQNSFCVT